MLTELERLSIEADGRYATDQELQFLQDYLQSVEKRISAYEKIRDAAETIIQQTKTAKQIQDRKTFYLGAEDKSEICLRDLTNLLRCSAAAMLVNDLDQMREGMLLWYQTIVRAFNYEQNTQTNYRVLEEMVKTHLTAEEAEVVEPVFQLNYSLLS